MPVTLCRYIYAFDPRVYVMDAATRAQEEIPRKDATVSADFH